MKIELGTGMWNIFEVAKVTNGNLIIGEESEFIGICTDSREALPKTLFIALKGERVDGHDYIINAVERGCRCVLAEHMVKNVEESISYILVSNVEEALMKMAAAYSEQIDEHITVGITGSVGKTTTKEFVSAVLKQKYSTFKTTGNFNSTIGMPMSMMQVSKDIEAVVLEMAMSGFGEIHSMSCTAKPDIAIITNIGTSHMEMLGSRENICRAKLEILHGLKDSGVAILNKDEPLLFGKTFSKQNIKWVSLEDKLSDYYAFNIRYSDKNTVFDLKLNDIIYNDLIINVLGEHSVYDAVYACAVGDILGLKECDIRQGLLDYQSADMRQQIYSLNNVTIIEDCYNASPESMLASLNVLKRFPVREGAKRVAVLGDMRELGENSAEYHISVGNAVPKCADMLFTIGNDAKYIAVGARNMGENNIFVNLDCEAFSATASELAEVLHEGDVMLVKASRAVRAERIIKCFEDIIKE